MSSPKASIAVTRPINPPGAEPKITVEQLWKCLVLKVRQPEIFLKEFFQSCEVIEEVGNKIHRKAKLNSGGYIEETCYLYEPTMIYFEGDPVRVNNIISYDANGELQITFTFVGGVPGLPPSATAADHDHLETAMRMGRQAAEDTVRHARELVREGKL